MHNISTRHAFHVDTIVVFSTLCELRHCLIVLMTCFALNVIFVLTHTVSMFHLLSCLSMAPVLAAPVPAVSVPAVSVPAVSVLAVSVLVPSFSATIRTVTSMLIAIVVTSMFTAPVTAI